MSRKKVQKKRGYYQRGLGWQKERYLKWCKAKGEKACADKEWRLEFTLYQIGESEVIADLTVEEIESKEAFRLDAEKQRGKKKGDLKKVSPANVNREIANLKHMLTRGVGWGILSDSPGRLISSH